MPKTKRSNEETSKEATGKKMKFDKETVDAAGFCTDPSAALSADDVAVILDGEETENISILKEKDLVGKGTKRLHKMDDNKLIFLYDGKKCVKKDRLRIQAMVDAALEEAPGAQAYVLLAAESKICKRNTLPELVEAGYVVQRAS